MKTDTLIDYSRVLGVLSQHIGEAKGISAVSLSVLAGSTVRHVRSMVTAMRLDGVAVCGTPETGYFIAANPEELQETCDFLHNRAMSSLLISSRMQKIPMQDLIGQLRIPT